MKHYFVTLACVTLGACLDTEPVDLGGDGSPTDAALANDATLGTGADASATAIPPEIVVDPTPCLDVTPALTDFGGTLVGTTKTAAVQVTNCGSAEVVVTDVAFGPGDPRHFDFDLGAFPRLAPGASSSIGVDYTPTTVAPIDPDGAPVRDVATLHVTVGATTFRAAFRGWGAATVCPTPIITVEEGAEIEARTTLHLSGTSSWGIAPIVGWEWSVRQPSGSAEVLRPSASVPAPTLSSNLVGTYTFRLEVVDAQGHRSCAPAELTVSVTDTVALRIELTWRTVEGDDPDDTADLDLHFRHPFAVGPDGTGYFDTPYDAFWFNASPNWGVFTTSDDDPNLTDDATEAPGPEVLELAVPEADVRYCASVHFWSPRVGRALATLRAFVHGELAFEAADVSLAPKDMWEVVCLTWPGPTIEDLAAPDGLPRIIPSYTAAGYADD